MATAVTLSHNAGHMTLHQVSCEYAGIQSCTDDFTTADLVKNQVKAETQIASWVMGNRPDFTTNMLTGYGLLKPPTCHSVQKRVY